MREQEIGRTGRPQVVDQVRERLIKCVVWDLDNTLWEGTLLEQEQVYVRPEGVDVIQTLDSRGILHSIASKNDYALAMRQLELSGLRDYFLYPQIHWGAKSSSLPVIAQALNIGIDTLAFVDDEPFERQEVAFSLPEVLCLDAADIATMPDLPVLTPRWITEDSRRRRFLYISEEQRTLYEEQFAGTKEEFLASLGMKLTISRARVGDLERVRELSIRTHQLNTTGYTYSYEELEFFLHSASHRLLIASLTDTFGTYGKVGLALLECQEKLWTIKLLLMSCRVMARGVGTILMNAILRLARRAGVLLQAEFVPNDHNRLMYVTYKFGGFREVGRSGKRLILVNDLKNIQPFPAYIHVALEK